MTTTIEPTTQNPLDPFGMLTNLVTALLAPMFLSVCNGDINLACHAAAETINAYRARNNADLLAVAQIIGFGFAALASLSLSMTGDISVSMALRLRGNANACNRAAEQNRRALARSQASAPAQAHPQSTTEPQGPPQPAESAPRPEPETFLHAAAEQLLAAESQARLEQPTHHLPEATNRDQQIWAIAMAKQATDIIASLPNLPPADRKEAGIRAEILSSTAHDLMQGATAAMPPTTARTP